MEHFIPCLRDAVTQVQVLLESAQSGQQTSAEADATTEEMTFADPALVADFVVESKEHLVVAEEQALALEKDPGNLESINAQFRAFHSIKGLAAFLDFDRVYRFAHEVETLLDYARNRELAVTPAVIDLILASADFLSRCMDAIQGGDLSSVPAIEEPLVARIRKTIEQCAKPAESCAGEASPAFSPDAAATVPLLSFESVAQPTEEDAESGAPSRPQEPQKPAATKGKVLPTANNRAERYSIRVDTDKLDHLMDMVGELVIAQSLVRTEITDQASPDSNLVRSVTQLAQITSDVQRTTLRMRMIPIGQLMRRTARIVRDLSRKFGKQVEVEFIGEETEVDKTIAEELADPLMHIVRNAIDHGIESPRNAIASGKKAVS